MITMRVDGVSASNGQQMQLWQQQQQITYEQRAIRQAQLLGAQFPNTETMAQNAKPPADSALRVVHQVDRTAVLLNTVSRHEARLMAESMQAQVQETMRSMESSSAIFDAQKYVEKPKYDAGQYFDKGA